MNFGSDQRVRDAFRATLQGEPSSASVLGTQEIDAADVLEVTDLANAIARAEEVIRARSSRVLTTSGPDSSPKPEDIFDKLVAAKPSVAQTAASEDSAESATDDAVGPAVHAPYRPTPLPPRTSNVPLPPGILRPATLLRAPEDVLATPIPTAPATPRSSTPATLLPAPILPPPPGISAHDAGANTIQPLPAAFIPPAARTAPILILDEDAFYHPAGRIRTLADVTLDGYRPEPTLMLRLRARRQSLTWVVAFIVAVLALFAIFAVAVGFGRASVETSEPASVAAPPSPPSPAPKVETKPAPSSPARGAEAAPIATAPEVPVFDVNSLKNAPPTRR